DAADPIGINVFAGNDKATVVTDTGVISDDILRRIDETTLLVLEANYDPYMLRFGPYQPFLKQRVASDEGHLSNEMAAQALLMMKRPDFMQVILAHRSENNNNAVLVTQTIGKMLVDGGVRIGPEMKLQHGQLNEIVSIRSVKR
ncbi:MAG: MBL fold hydrolase, partial [Veillonella sp.]|nr:MBL fold hydrolase [Veillonella sp.]